MRDEFEASLANNPFDLDLTYDTENMCYKDIRVAWIFYGWCVGIGEGICEG